MALELPARRLKDVHLTRRAAENGLNACFDETVHCLAQEPTMTVLRVAVLEGDKDVAYETCLLSSLRSGYRVLHLRSLLGTRLEGCVLFVQISRGVEPNSFGITGQKVQTEMARLEARVKQLEEQVKTERARQRVMRLKHLRTERIMNADALDVSLAKSASAEALIQAPRSLGTTKTWLPDAKHEASEGAEVEPAGSTAEELWCLSRGSGGLSRTSSPNEANEASSPAEGVQVEWSAQKTAIKWLSEAVNRKVEEGDQCGELDPSSLSPGSTLQYGLAPLESGEQCEEQRVIQLSAFLHSVAEELAPGPSLRRSSGDELKSGGPAQRPLQLSFPLHETDVLKLVAGFSRGQLPSKEWVRPLS